MKLYLIQLFISLIICENLLFEKVHLVDYNETTSNFFFRGNLPVLNQKFAINELSEYFSRRSLEKKIDFPKNFTLIDISMLWAIEEPFTDYRYEVKYWEGVKNGSFIEWPIGFSGLIITPNMMTNSMAKYSANKFVSIDGIFDKIKYIREILNTKYNIPYVIYTHCHHGCDRTGYLVGSYRMFYYGLKVEDIYQQNLNECGRTQDYFSTESLKWFCIDLAEKNKMDYGDCFEFAKCWPWNYCTFN